MAAKRFCLLFLVLAAWPVKMAWSGTQSISEKGKGRVHLEAKFVELVKQGTVAQVRDLLESQPSLVNAQNTHGVSVVAISVYYGRKPITQELLRHHPKLNIFEACMLGKAQLAERMVASDASLVNGYSADGFTPLHLAVFLGTPETAEMLLAHGAQVNAVSLNSMHVQPLHSALARTNARVGAEMAHILIAKGANVNATQEGGFTPLHEAAQNNNGAAVKELLRHKADANLKTSKGHTPFDLAKEANALDAIQALQENQTVSG